MLEGEEGERHALSLEGEEMKLAITIPISNSQKVLEV